VGEPTDELAIGRGRQWSTCRIFGFCEALLDVELLPDGSFDLKP
jgi:hypothetical protein